MHHHPLPVFIGFDARQPVAFHVLSHSIWARASCEVVIRPLRLAQLPMKRKGLTEFTYSRFLAPYLCGYKGWSIFIDSDFLCQGDLSELVKLAQERSEMTTDVFVVQNQLRFEWASMMVFRNYSCSRLTPAYVDDTANKLYDFGWAREVGELPAEWNHLVGYDSPKAAKLVHFTQGIPCWPETKDSEYAAEWLTEAQEMASTVSWQELMGRSVHSKPVLERLKHAAGV
jgi:hypothetical protein